MENDSTSDVKKFLTDERKDATIVSKIARSFGSSATVGLIAAGFNIFAKDAIMPDRLGTVRFTDLIQIANFFMLLAFVVIYAVSTKPSDVLRQQNAELSVLQSQIEKKASAIELQVAANAKAIEVTAKENEKAAAANRDLVAAQRDLLKEFSKIQSALIMLIQNNMHESAGLREKLQAVAEKNGLELPEFVK